MQSRRRILPPSWPSLELDDREFADADGPRRRHCGWSRTTAAARKTWIVSAASRRGHAGRRGYDPRPAETTFAGGHHPDDSGVHVPHIRGTAYGDSPFRRPLAEANEPATMPIRRLAVDDIGASRTP